jgi:hypothetical protein
MFLTAQSRNSDASTSDKYQRIESTNSRRLSRGFCAIPPRGFLLLPKNLNRAEHEQEGNEIEVNIHRQG